MNEMRAELKKINYSDIDVGLYDFSLHFKKFVIAGL